MPYINIKTNKRVTLFGEASLITKLGHRIELFPGKSERWLMVNIDDECRMAFAGTKDGCAMIEVKLFGVPDVRACDKFTEAVTKDVAGLLSISPDRIYVKYEGCTLWGAGGTHF